MKLERGSFAALIRRPSLWSEAISAFLSFRSLRSDAYISWRHLTAYGDEVTTMSAQDLVNYLIWRREMRAIRKWERVW